MFFTVLLELLAFLNSSLCSGKACDRNAEGRAGNVVQADLVAELNGNRVAAVLTADTAVDLGTSLLPLPAFCLRFASKKSSTAFFILYSPFVAVSRLFTKNPLG